VLVDVLCSLESIETLFGVQEGLDDDNFGHFIERLELSILQQNQSFISGLLDFAVPELAPDCIALDDRADKRIVVPSKLYNNLF
jgi:hypothetical protein